MGNNGWRKGYDPVQRWLRIVTTLVVLGVFVVLSVGDDNENDILVIALALGAVLLLLGYESVIRLPIISAERRRQREEEEDDG